MAKIMLRYDAPCDVLYVRSRQAKTVNVPISADEILCVDPDALEVVGSIHTNFSITYPKIVKVLEQDSKTAREGAEEFFELGLRDLNASLSAFRSKKALLDFLRNERGGSRIRVHA